MNGVADDGELREMKAVIRSLLIARSQPITYEILCSDYRDQVGKRLDHKRFGYPTPDRFLDDLKDTVQLVESPYGLKLKPVPHKDSIHIRELVTSQNQLSRGARYGKRYRTIHWSRNRSKLPYQARRPWQDQRYARMPNLLDLNIEPPPALETKQSTSPRANSPAPMALSPKTVSEPAPETVPEPGDEKNPELPSSKPSSESLQGARPALEPAVSPSTKNEAMKPAQHVLPSPAEWRTPLLPRQPPMAAHFNGFSMPHWNVLYPHGLPPPYPIDPFFYSSWFPSNPYQNYYSQYCPVYPGYAMQSFPLWDKADQNLKFDGPLGYSGANANVLGGQTVNHDEAKKSNADSLAPTETHNSPATGNATQRRCGPVGYSDEESLVSFRQSPFELKDDDAVHYSLKASGLVHEPLFGKPELRQSEPETQLKSPDTDNSACADNTSDKVLDFALPRKLDIRDFEPQIRAVLKKFPNGLSIPDFLREYEKENSEPLDFMKLGYPSMEYVVLENRDIFVYEKRLDSDQISIYDAKPHTRLCPIVNRRWIPSHVQDGLALLAKDYPNGISTDNIVSLYKESYSTDINPKELGFNSIFDLLKDCCSICVKKYDDTCLVYPKQYWTTFENSFLPDADEPAEKEKIKYLWNGHYKEYECDPLFKYKPPILPEEEMVLVKIADAQSPDQFWIQFVHNIESLTDLMCQMNIHYEMEKENYRLPYQFVEPGLAVAVLFKGTLQWHRARIESFEGEQVKIFYVDFGTIQFVKRSDLRKLDMRFGKDPMYAVKASMYRIRPPTDTNEWPAASYDFFYENYTDIILYASICKRNTRDPLCPAIEVVLYRTDPNGLDEEIVNETFIQMKFASDQFAPTIPEPVFIEAVTFSKSNIDVIGKLVPLWLTASKTGSHDVETTMMNLKFCVEKHSIPMGIREAPCCLRHVIQRFFHDNPVKLSELWESAYSRFEDRLLQQVCSNLSSQLDEFGWSSYLSRPMSCSAGNAGSGS